jgi:hypothetical protein
VFVQDKSGYASRAFFDFLCVLRAFAVQLGSLGFHDDQALRIRDTHDRHRHGAGERLVDVRGGWRSGAA